MVDKKEFMSDQAINVREIIRHIKGGGQVVFDPELAEINEQPRAPKPVIDSNRGDLQFRRDFDPTVLGRAEK